MLTLLKVKGSIQICIELNETDNVSYSGVLMTGRLAIKLSAAQDEVRGGLMDQVLFDMDYHAMLDANKPGANGAIRKALEQGLKPQDFVFSMVVPGIEKILNTLYISREIAQSRYFLTNSIASDALDIILSLLKTSPGGTGTVILGTPPGDIKKLHCPKTLLQYCHEFLQLTARSLWSIGVNLLSCTASTSTAEIIDSQQSTELALPRIRKDSTAAGAMIFFNGGGRNGSQLTQLVSETPFRAFYLNSHDSFPQGEENIRRIISRALTSCVYGAAL